MPSSPNITELWGNFKNLVKKITYDKTEVDDKLSAKANNSLVNQSSNGLMSSTDKVKLDGIATGANKTVVDSSLSTTSANPVQNKVINTALNGKANSNHSHSVVTTSVDGFMSNDDKIKLNGIATGANKTVVDSSLSTTSANPVQNKVINTALNRKANSNHSHSVVTTSVDGFMSNDDKIKLNGIATGANKTVVDTALSSSSTNPVQNKVVNAQLTSLNNNKANTNHTHGVAKQTRTIASNTFLTQLGNLAIFSWWQQPINISSANTWVNVWTLPVTNKGKTVWSVNIYNGVDLCYFRINENFNKVQAFSNKTGSIPLQPGELVFFIE